MSLTSPDGVIIFIAGVFVIGIYFLSKKLLRREVKPSADQIEKWLVLSVTGILAIVAALMFLTQ